MQACPAGACSLLFAAASWAWSQSTGAAAPVDPQWTTGPNGLRTYAVGSVPLELEYSPGGDQVRSFQVVVQPGTRVKMVVKSDMSAGFCVRVVDRSGRVGRGMRNPLQWIKPEATFQNAGSKPEAVYFVVSLAPGGSPCTPVPGTPAYRVVAALVP